MYNGNLKERNVGFALCNNLSEVELEEGVEIIRTIAFGDCNYRTINIPNSVILIEEGAFSGATNNDIDSYTGKFTTSDNKCIIFDNILINYAIGCSSTYYRVPYFITKIGQYSFSRADKLKEIQLSSTVKTIGSYAFQFCSNIESVVLNEGLTSIEDEVFRECRKLSNITIPESVESIGEKAFYNLSDVKKAIRNAVLNNGKSILDFPEYWGDDLMDVNQVEVDKALRLLKPSFGL